RARLLRIALTRGRAAHHGRGLEAVGGTGRAGAGAALGGVAEARRGAADGPGVAGRVRARGGAGGAVAHVGGADVAVVRAGRPRRRPCRWRWPPPTRAGPPVWHRRHRTPSRSRSGTRDRWWCGDPGCPRWDRTVRARAGCSRSRGERLVELRLDPDRAVEQL